MATFNELWALLYEHGATNYHKHDCEQIWDGLAPEQQQGLYDKIAERLNRNQYVAYNPLEAIHDNMPRRKALSIGTPTDWNGKVAPAQTEIACYNGHWGMYTLADIERFNLQTKSNNHG